MNSCLFVFVGVLLLNAVLTVEASKANSHKGKGWEDLTSSVIKWISRNLRNVVFLLWGANAIKIGGLVDRERHCVLTSVHPSPLSAHRLVDWCLLVTLLICYAHVNVIVLIAGASWDADTFQSVTSSWLGKGLSLLGGGSCLNVFLDLILIWCN